MEQSIITFQADEQQLVKTGGVDKFASSTVAYVEAQFTLGTNWTGFDSVRAMWRFGSDVMATVLDHEGKCQVPHELLERRGELKVNLVGSIVEDEVISDRLTTYPIVALIITKVAMVTSDETEVTPSQFEQFVAIVKDDADRAEDARDDAESAESNASQSAEDADIARIKAEDAQNSAEIAQGKAEDAQEEAERLVSQIQDLSATGVQLLPSQTAYASYNAETGILTIGIPQGVQGEQGEQGEKGDKGDTGATGATGATGNGIASVAKTGTSGLVDTYTITFTNGQTTTFNVTNGEDGSVAPSAIASDYSSSATYAVGDYVWYDGDLYKCVSAISVGEVWTQGHWTEVALADEVSDYIDKINATLGNSYETISLDSLEFYSNGYINNNGAVMSPSSTSHKIVVMDASNLSAVKFQASTALITSLAFGVLKDSGGNTLKVLYSPSTTDAIEWEFVPQTGNKLYISWYNYATTPNPYYSSFGAKNYTSIVKAYAKEIVALNPTKYMTCVKKPFDFLNKKLQFFGDSITYGYIAANGSVPTHQATNQYPKLFAQAVGATYENDGVSGTTLAETSYGSIYTKIQNTTLDGDYVFVAGGVNDWQTGVNEGTLKTAVTNICNYLQQNFNGEVIFITPIYEAGRVPIVTPTQSLQNVRNVITQIALEYGYSVVQGWEFPFPTENDDSNYISTMFQDKIHPTELGYSMYAQALRNALC